MELERVQFNKKTPLLMFMPQVLNDISVQITSFCVTIKQIMRKWFLYKVQNFFH